MARTRRMGLTLLVATLAACDTGTDPNLETGTLLNGDVAMVAADAALADLSFMQDSGTPGMGPAGTAGAPLERSRTVEFFDAEGDEMDGYDPLLTDEVHIVVEVSGETSRDTWSASIERERDFTVSGLAGTETTRTWNGTSSAEVSRSRHGDGGTRTYDMTEEGTVEDVVVGVPRAEHPWPLSGTIKRHVTVKLAGPQGEVEREREVVIVFDGTQFPDMTVNGETFDLDLAARVGERPVRRRGG